MHQITINPHFTPHLLNIIMTIQRKQQRRRLKKVDIYYYYLHAIFQSISTPTHTHMCHTSTQS